MTPASWIERYSMPARDHGAGARHSRAAAHGLSAVHGAAALGGTVAERAAGLHRAAALRVSSLAALPAAAPVVCHSDLHVLNLIDRGQSLILLDWEYAHAAEPLWDLAGWSGNNDLEEPLRHELLRGYLERTPTHEDHARLSLLIWLFDYVCWLWSALYLESGRLGVAGPADAAQAAVAARARLLEARLTCPQRASGIWRFPS
jgi:aminoglycoside phosphotransferase (APT) family kinase protein